MFFPEGQVWVHVYGRPVDMRKSYDGLAQTSILAQTCQALLYAMRFAIAPHFQRGYQLADKVDLPPSA
jgi:hypothetical protein